MSPVLKKKPLKVPFFSLKFLDNFQFGSCPHTSIVCVQKQGLYFERYLLRVSSVRVFAAFVAIGWPWRAILFSQQHLICSWYGPPFSFILPYTKNTVSADASEKAHRDSYKSVSYTLLSMHTHNTLMYWLHVSCAFSKENNSDLVIFVTFLLCFF